MSEFALQVARLKIASCLIMALIEITIDRRGLSRV